MLLSIVIVEYKSTQEIYRCVNALKEKISFPFEVIVSSNSLYDRQTQKSIRKSCRDVRWVFNEENGGFAYAMNRGLAHARGDYLVIMNSDCLLKSDLMPMLRFMEANAAVGAIAPQIRDAEGNIQDTARPYVTPLRFIRRSIHQRLSHTSCVMERSMDYSKTQTVDWVIGAFIMVSRKAYELTRGLDEKYFMYAEDVDWCTRIRTKGMEVVYYPNVLIEYKGTRRARNSWKYSRIFIKSHLRYWRKFGFFHGYPKRRNIRLSHEN